MSKKYLITILLLSFMYLLSPKDVVDTSSHTIVINEAFPDPEGTDAGKEWIEFSNLSNSDINLKGYRLENINLDSGSIRNISITSDLILPSNSLGVISEGSLSDLTAPNFIIGSGKLNLYNTKAKLLLYSPTNALVHEFVYLETKSGKSIESPGYPHCIKNVVNESGNTVGKENLNILTICSDTLKGHFEYSEDGEVWISDPNQYSKQLFIRFKAIDNIDVAQKIYIINDLSQQDEIILPLTASIETNVQLNILLTSSYTSIVYNFDINVIFGRFEEKIIPKILITQIYPAPKSGEKEYIIIRNLSNVKFKDNIYLTDNVDVPTQKKIFVDIEPSGETKILDIPSLNNSGDEIYLYYEDALIDHIIYSGSETGVSFENMNSSALPREFKKPIVVIPLQTISDVKKHKKGTSIKTKGTITYLDQSFAYIQDETGGIRIAGFSEISVGKSYEITGDLSEALGEKKITNIENIREVEKITFQISNFDISNLGNLLGRVISGDATILANYSKSFKISEKVTISLIGFDGFDRTKGDTIRFIGVLTKSDSDSYKILPIELTRLDTDVEGISVSYPIAIIDAKKELNTTIENIRSNGINSLGIALGAITIYFIYRFLRTKSDILMLKFRLWRESRKMQRSPSSEKNMKSNIASVSS